MENTSKGAIIEQLIRHGTLSRSEIARRTGLSRSIITLSTIELMRQGIIQKDGTGVSTGGRRPDEFRLGGGNHLVIGVSLEDDLSIVSFYTLDGQRVDGSIEPLAPGLSAVQVIAQVARQINTLTSDYQSASFIGCGMALPSIVDAETDLVTSTTLNWSGVPARAILEEAIGIPCNLLDNAHAAALGELWIGGRQLRENLIYLYLGRGIGGAIILDRKLYLGRNHAAGEFGPMYIGGTTADGPFHGRFEHLALQPAMIDWMNSVRDRYPASGMPPDPPRHDFLPMLAAAVDQGDNLATAVKQRLAIFTATACANLINSLNPDEIIIGGQVAVLGESFAAAVYGYAEQWTLPLPFGSVRIHVANPRQETIPLGVAATIIQRASELLARLPGS
jgi:predicted NBD/HSP70 family sugar kinase